MAGALIQFMITVVRENLFDFDETRTGSGVVDDYLNRALGFAVAIT
jgi:hypothetical protein